MAGYWKGRFDSQATQVLTKKKMFNLNKSIWIKVSAKCIHVNVNGTRPYTPPPPPPQLYAPAVNYLIFISKKKRLRLRM